MPFISLAIRSATLTSSLACVALLYLLPALVHAGPNAAPKEAAPREAAKSDPAASAPLGLRVALGLSGGVNGSFLQKPQDELYYVSENSGADYVYPGFGGVGGLVALQLDLGWRFITLSTGYTQSFDQADGKADGGTLTISQTTTHIPLTLRFELPLELVRPSLFGGLDWVSPSDSSVEYTRPLSPYQGIRSESYRAWTFGFGLDFMVSELIRIPLRFYGVLNPTPRDSLNDSIALQVIGNQITNAELRGEWDWQAGVTVGFSYDVYRR